MKILYPDWMQEIDKTTIQDIGIPSIVLMENASQGACRFFRRQYTIQDFPKTIILIGKGNNGGDGMAVGRLLFQRGYQVKFILLSDPKSLPADSRTNFKILQNLNLEIIQIRTISELEDVFNSHSVNDTFIIDAIFGTGLSSAVKPGIFQDTIELVTRYEFKIASIDIPSGISEKIPPETTRHITADCTATFQALKLSHIYPDGNKYCGRIKIIDIGIPKEIIEQDKYYINLISPENFQAMLSAREIDSHKGTFGHCLNISGSLEKPGAGILSSFAILKSGAGLCTCAVNKENRKIYIQAHPELMELLYSDPSDLEKVINDFDSILLGPGLGQGKTIFEIVSNTLLISRSPLILDADALNILSKSTSILKQKRKCPLIITPHPGEFARITHLSSDEIRYNRIKHCREFSLNYNLFLILKGHHTIISTPDGRIFINQTGNPGMATAGSGDVLSGIIAGFITQFSKQMDLDKILQAAVFIHGLAGDLAAADLTEISTTAGDLIKYIPQALKKAHEFNNNIKFS
jgi:NAD(P)H-hydrate epimerase